MIPRAVRTVLHDPLPSSLPLFSSPYIAPQSEKSKITVIRNALMDISAWFLSQNDEKYPCTYYHRQRLFISAEIFSSAFLMAVILRHSIITTPYCYSYAPPSPFVFLF